MSRCHEPSGSAGVDGKGQGASEASEVTLSGDSGALVSVDGRLVGALPLAQPLLLQAGAHQLRFERGARKVETQVALPARRQAELRVTFAPPVALLTLTPLVLVVEEVALPPALAAVLAQVLAAALVKERALPIAAAAREAAGRRAPALLCQPADQPCLLRLAERLGAQLLLRLQAQPEPPPSGERGGALWLSVTVVDVAARAPAALLQRGLPLEAGALLAQEEALLRDADETRDAQELGEAVHVLPPAGVDAGRGTAAVERPAARKTPEPRLAEKKLESKPDRADDDALGVAAVARGAEPADVLADGLPREGVGAGFGRGREAGAQIDAGAGGHGAGELAAQALEAAAVPVDPVVAEAVAGGGGPRGVAGVVEAKRDLERLAGGERGERGRGGERPGEAGVGGDHLDGDQEVVGEAGGAPPALVLADGLELQEVAAGRGRGADGGAGAARAGRPGVGRPAAQAPGRRLIAILVRWPRR